jgi:hypothetical protein
MNSLSFLSQPLLWGMALAAIPVIIHLLFRRRFRRIDWAPMRYLKLSMQRNRRRIRLEQLLLLLLRTAIVLLLFFLVARPVMHAQGLGGWLGGRSRTSHILVLDDSLSMDYRDQGQSAFARAKQIAGQILATVGPKDRFTLAVTSQPRSPLVREVELTDPDTVERLLDGLGVAGVFCAWPPVFEALDELVQSGTYPLRNVTIITDLRRAGWDEHVRTVANRWAAGHVRLRLFDVGSQKMDDVALVSLEQTEGVALVGTPTSWVATVHNGSTITTAERDANFIIDGKPSLVRIPAIEPRNTARVPLAAMFQEPGLHHVAFTIALPADALPANDQAWAIADVKEDLHVMLVDGEPSSDPLSGEVDFLALALSLGIGKAEAFRVETVTDAEWADVISAAPDLVVLANVANLTPEQTVQVTRLIEAGTSLMVFLGDEIDPDRYNQTLYKNGAGLLPAALDSVADEEVAGLLLEGVDPGPFDALAQLKAGVLQRIRVRKFYQVRLPDHETENVRVLARWNNPQTSPAVLEKKVGHGRVLLWTVTADKQWTSWPTEPSYVLAVREAARAIAHSDATTRSLTSGEVLRRLLAPGRDVKAPLVEVPGLATPEPLRVEQTSDAPTTAATESPRVLTYTDTRRTGLYKLVWQDARAGSQHDVMAVNPDKRENDLARISLDELRKLFGELDVEVIPAAAATDAPLAIEGREIWRNLATALAGLLISEACFATWVGRQR